MLLHSQLRETTLPKFKVTATMDVGYEAVVTARNEAEAWQMANDDVAPIEWVQTDEGHDWTLENVYEVEDKTKYPEWKVVDPYFTEKRLKKWKKSG